jgi:hypothetical protein
VKDPFDFAGKKEKTKQGLWVGEGL